MHRKARLAALAKWFVPAPTKPVASLLTVRPGRKARRPFAYV